MKTIRALKGQRFLIGVLLLGLLLAPAAGLVMAQGPGPQGDDTPQDSVSSAFTYQGRLKNASGLVNSTCDFRFSLWDAAGSGTPPSGGTQIGTTQTEPNVTVSEGLFTVDLDFGYGAFTGDARWLQIAVRCPAGSGSYTPLSPRQPLTAAPHALSLQSGARIHNRATSGQTSGIYLQSDHGSGVSVGSAGDDGAYVHQAGSPSTTHPEVEAKNGFEVAGAEGYGLYVGQSDLDGVYVNSATSDGVHVVSTGSNGVTVDSAGSSGVAVASAGSSGVYVASAGNDGVYVHHAGNPSTTNSSAAKNGFEVAGAEGYGLYVGRADLDGVYVNSAKYDGVRVASATSAGVRVDSAGWDGVTVNSAPNASGAYVGAAKYGVYVNQTSDDGVYVNTAGSPSSTTSSTAKNGFEVAGAEGIGLYVGRADGYGVFVNSAEYDGVRVASAGSSGVRVESADEDGVNVVSAGNPSTMYYTGLDNGFEVAGAEGFGLYVGRADADGVFVQSAGGYAGYFNGTGYFAGALTKAGGGFKIDHPQDPANKYLYHSYVESPDMMNVYNGNVTLDANGEAWVELPEWFEALNGGPEHRSDFRYQLTCIGGFAPVYIAQEIQNNRFQIAGGTPGMKVSWQVTGIRRDPWAEANRLPVEEDKPAEERGTYLHPAIYGQPETMGLAYKEAQVRGGGE